jgi:nicotinate phosphoribosyltransferase
MTGDVLSVEADGHDGEPLIQPVMRAGRRIQPAPPLAEVRARVGRELQRLPEPLRRLEAGAAYPVQVADALVELAKAVDRRLAGPEGRP